ncbi:MAG: YegS/Rv2252/BmrU family lipid kinase [Clostridium sp.]|nr:YegS/Rv2252/BmrU family lipid kinase [Clostridium sp.]
MPRKKKLVFVVNPISGTTSKKLILQMLSERLSPDRFDWKVIKTEYPGHAAILAAQEAEAGADAVVAIGGDGTVNEVARSLVHTNTALGIIPCGSGNGLARHLLIPMDPAGAIDIIDQCIIKDLDYGRINDIPFFCTCGVGFDAFVSSKFAQSGKRGLLSYLENTLREGIKYQSDIYEIDIDGEKSKYRAFLIACANASQYGNNVYIAPHACMHDGLMDVTIMEPFSVLEAPQIAFQLFNKTITSNSRIKTFQCQKLHISREQPGVIHFDGDPVMAGKELDVEVIKKGLKVIVNPGGVSPTPPPLLKMFTDFYSDLANLSEDFIHGNQRILTLNKELLRKLRQK